MSWVVMDPGAGEHGGAEETSPIVCGGIIFVYHRKSTVARQ